ncbi:hypothetical protein C8R46DRAFT_997239 [Mycena filopes]|nr:hypothetical protein C8R46DRAFT_997239 [Mycena filopes]
MAPDAGARSSADQEYLDSVSARQLMDFRNFAFTPAYIALNPAKFLDHDWVNLPDLKLYLGAVSASDASSTAQPTRSDPVQVKVEPALLSVTVKTEPQVLGLPTHTRDVEVIEISSDSDDSDVEVMDALRPGSRSSSVHPFSDVDLIEPHTDAPALDHPSGLENPRPDSRSSTYSHLHRIESDTDERDGQASRPSGLDDPRSDSETDAAADSDHADDDLVESDTVWQDDGTSLARVGTFRLTRKLTVERMEYRQGPAALYPIHRVRTGIVVDLGAAKYVFRHPNTGELISLISIINDSDNDGWDWAGGGARAFAKVQFAPGERPIECRRIGMTCKGVYACDQLAPALRTVVRFELDPASREAVLAAQQDTRRREGNTPEERVALFTKVLRDAKCPAVDSTGKKCRGGPLLKTKTYGRSNGHDYFIGCTGWKPSWKTNHRFTKIPDNVDENLLAKALAGVALTDDATKDTQPCSAIIPSRTGLKKKTCSHAHIANGVQIVGHIRNYACEASRYVYVPTDSSIRKVLILNAVKPHNHPMPVLTKATFEVKDKYRELIAANGVLGATVSKIDNAPSTKLLLNGKTPSAHAPALHNKRLKQDLIHTAKLEQYPNGLDVEAIYPIYQKEQLTKPLPERYIHSYITNKKGEIAIITFVPYLLKLLDDPGVTSFDGDTTFKGVEGKLNEWELSIFAKVVQRAASLVRSYITGSSTDFFEFFFDELQRVKLLVTGKPIPLKAFVRGGNLLVTNVDMDAPQVLGLCKAVMKYNDPEYSGIPHDTPPEKVAPHFVKICWRHGKEPVHDFRALVSAAEFSRLMNFVYIDSKESLDAFSTFVYGLKVKKITDWWKHKEMHEWIIPCIVKSQSFLSADVWDSTPSTTNTNEAQHHWTNTLAGIRLSPVEALESRRTIDTNVAEEIERSLKTGILSNSNNDLVHRMSRNAQRQSATDRKALESRTAADDAKQIRLRLEGEVEKRRVSNETTKALTQQLKVATGKAGKARKSADLPSASSSGRVKSARSKPARPPAPATQSPPTSPTDSAASLPVVQAEPALPVVALPPSNPVQFANTPAFDQTSNDFGFNFYADVPNTNFDVTPVQTLNAPALNSSNDFNHGFDFNFGYSDVPNTGFGTNGIVHSTSTPALNSSSEFNFNFGDSDMATATFTSFNPISDPTLFGFTASAFNTLLPSARDPLDDFMQFCESSGVLFTDPEPSASGSGNFDALPLLPPPPPESPPAAMQLAVEPTLEVGPSAPKSRRGPRQEVDTANVLNSTRTRAPSARKRDADADISTRASKKTKSG